MCVIKVPYNVGRGAAFLKPARSHGRLKALFALQGVCVKTNRRTHSSDDLEEQNENELNSCLYEDYFFPTLFFDEYKGSCKQLLLTMSIPNSGSSRITILHPLQ